MTVAGFVASRLCWVEWTPTLLGIPYALLGHGRNVALGVNVTLGAANADAPAASLARGPLTRP